ncbi:MAG: outer membrane protein assembly factor BamD [Flavobacteriales bacterium]|nr:outer membrane protein assembly factor BamD [Flavobacteriales bacterium]
MRRLSPLLLAAVLLAGCSEFQKAQKSGDVAYKSEVAEKYYAAGKHDRAVPLLEELIVLCRGAECSERVNYLHAMAHFGLKDYILSAYYLANFTRTFPKSRYAEECAFLSAYCHYRNSPAWPLDQEETRHAIDQLQLFMVRYPHTELKDSCNTLIDQLRGKLEVKAYEAARQYYHMRNYQAAGVAFRSFVRDWPNSRFREEALLRTLQADHQLAMNSVADKRGERVAEAIRSYHNFADAFPESRQKALAERIHKELNTALEQGPP